MLANMMRIYCTEENVSCVKPKEKQENIGAKVDFLVSTDVNGTVQK